MDLAKDFKRRVGSYRSTYQLLLAATQAANSRLWTFRNPTTNVMVVHSLRLEVMQIGAFTAAVLASFNLFRLSAFTAEDTTDEVALGTVLLDSLGTAASGAIINGVTTTGVAAGMTGGTLTKVPTPLSIDAEWFQAAIPTATPTIRLERDLIATYHRPPIIRTNEGLDLENANLLGAAANARVWIAVDFEVFEPRS